MIDNIFLPLFEVTLDPSKDEKLFKSLFNIVGFDTVDDESSFEILVLNDLKVKPD